MDYNEKVIVLIQRAARAIDYTLRKCSSKEDLSLLQTEIILTVGLKGKAMISDLSKELLIT